MQRVAILHAALPTPLPFPHSPVPAILILRPGQYYYLIH